jgi:RNA polymerase sigma-70 factor (ECF subfamily)
MSDTIDRLVKSAQAGNACAFDQIYQHCHGLVHAIALTRVPYADVEDVVQEAFTIAWRSLAALREADKFEAWLAQITRRHCMRHTGRRKPPDELPELATTTPQLADALGVLAAMRDLPEDYQEVLIMRFCEGLTAPQIAQLHGMTPGSVRVKIYRGLEQLRAKFGRKEAP